MIPKLPGIYKITNKINNNCYIGSATNLSRRWITHTYALKAKRHRNNHLQNAWNLYGKNSFTFEVLFFCEIKDLIFFEQRAIDTYKPEYNICQIAGNTLGRKLSEEQKAKISKALIGRPCSEETRQKISEAKKGKDIPPEARERQAAKMRGKKMPPKTEEMKQAISERLMGHAVSKETRKKISEKAKERNITGANNPNFGKKWTEEQKRAMSEKKKNLFTIKSKKKEGEKEDSFLSPISPPLKDI